jgi:hypothetical protein
MAKKKVASKNDNGFEEKNRVTPQILSLAKWGAGQPSPQGNSGEIKERKKDR